MKYHVCWENVTDPTFFIFLSLRIIFFTNYRFLEICNLQNGNVLMIFKIEICSLRNGNMLTICKFAIPILQIISIFPFRKYLQIFISFGFVSPIIVGPMKQKYRSQIASRNLCVVDLMLKRKQIR